MPFQLDAPGQYTVICECVDRVENRVISLGSYSTELPVEPAPLSLVLRRAPDGEVVFPRSRRDSPEADAVKGGEQIYAELRGQENVLPARTWTPSCT